MKRTKTHSQALGWITREEPELKEHRALELAHMIFTPGADIICTILNNKPSPLCTELNSLFSEVLPIQSTFLKR